MRPRMASTLLLTRMASVKSPVNVGERGEEEIAEIVADEAVAGMKTVLKETAEKGFRLSKEPPCSCECRQAGGWISAAKAAGTAAVIGDRDDGGEIGDGAFGAGVLVGAADHVFLSGRGGAWRGRCHLQE